MIINGKERKFFLTVGASCTIAELCPDGDIANIGKLFDSGRYSKNMTTIAKFISAMNRGYEERTNPGAEKPDVLTVRELMSLTMDEFTQAENEAFAAFNGDTKTTIETAEPKGSKKNEDVDEN